MLARPAGNVTWYLEQSFEQHFGATCHIVSLWQRVFASGNGVLGKPLSALHSRSQAKDSTPADELLAFS